LYGIHDINMANITKCNNKLDVDANNKTVIYGYELCEYVI